MSNARIADHETLIKRVLGTNYLSLTLGRLTIDEHVDDGSTVKVSVRENDATIEVEGKGVGVVDALYSGLLDRYARDYESLRSIRLTAFRVAADVASKKGQTGLDAIGQVTIDVTNSEGRHFSFSSASRSVTASTATAVLELVQFFVNSERAFMTLRNARRDASERGREDLVSRYTAEMAELVESTSYAGVIASARDAETTGATKPPNPTK